MPRLTSIEDSIDILCWMFNVLNADNTAQKELFVGIGLVWWDNAWTVDHVDAFHQRDVLPNLCFAGNWCDVAYFLLAQGVYDRGFAGIWVSNEPDAYLLPVG